MPTGGREAKLNQEQSQELIKELTERTYLKTVQICAYVKGKYGISYSRSGMTDWLQNHGFVYKKPKKVPGKLNPAPQEVFIKAYEELKSNLKANEEIYFLNAVHPAYQSQEACGSIKKGEEKALQTTATQAKLH